MGQVGLHALFGLAVGEQLVRPWLNEKVERRAAMFGFVMGNIAPDLDFLAVIAMYPVDHHMAVHLHRGFTHSLLAVIAVVVGFTISSALMRDKYLKYLGYGFALGIVGHFTKDIFLWFSSVDIFWPASIFGVIPRVNAWFWWTTPPLLGRLMGAAELAAFGLYYDHLSRLADEQKADLDMIPVLQRMSTICWVSWALLTALALDLPSTTFDMYMYIPLGIVFMPSCIYLTWRLQTTIEFVGLFGRPHHQQKSEP